LFSPEAAGSILSLSRTTGEATTVASVGRNQLCPCGSGKKYKKYHGSAQYTEQNAAQLKMMISRTDAQRIQRARQQGHGRAITSTEVNGHRFVAVKNRLLHSQGWRTFHDFLGDYIKAAFGVTWGNAEINKSAELRHPVIRRVSGTDHD
jgi:hypothetical protein